jgi:hypothetical protein
MFPTTTTRRALLRPLLTVAIRRSGLVPLVQVALFYLCFVLLLVLGLLNAR